MATVAAVATLISKEQESSTIGQLRSIALLNFEGKIFFSVIPKRMTKFLLHNNQIDTNCQKAGVPGFSGCSEHATIIWDQIEFENVHGSVPHQLISFALKTSRATMLMRRYATHCRNTQPSGNTWAGELRWCVPSHPSSSEPRLRSS